MEVKRYTRFVTTGKCPAFLAKCLYQSFFGWMVTDFEWRLAASGRWECTLRRMARCLYAYDGTTKPLRCKVFDRIGLVNMLRLGWLLLWSKWYDAPPAESSGIEEPGTK